MSSESRWAHLMDHITFFGDCMVLIIPIGLFFSMALMNFVSALGLSAVGFVLGVSTAPAATLAVAWLLRGEVFDRKMGLDLVWTAALVVVLAAAVYGTVVTQGLDQSLGFGTVAAIALGIEALAAVVLLADSIGDLWKGRTHIALDMIRLIGVVFIAASLALFWTNPDVGEMLIVIAPLGVAGGIAGLIGEGISAMRSRIVLHAGGRTPTAA